MTGETENGRSIRVTSRLLPRNSYLLTHQAAATPNTRLSGTEMATASKVRRRAARASGSASALKKVPTPAFSASLSTTTSGSSRSRANTAQAALISAMRPPWRTGRLAAAGSAAATLRVLISGSLVIANVALQQVDQQQQDEGDHQHQHADGG